MTGKGKENATRNVTVNQKCNGRGVPVAGGMLKCHRITEHNHLQKDGMAGSAALTILVFVVNLFALLFLCFIYFLKERILFLDFCRTSSISCIMNLN